MSKEIRCVLLSKRIPAAVSSLSIGPRCIRVTAEVARLDRMWLCTSLSPIGQSKDQNSEEDTRVRTQSRLGFVLRLAHRTKVMIGCTQNLHCKLLNEATVCEFQVRLTVNSLEYEEAGPARIAKAPLPTTRGCHPVIGGTALTCYIFWAWQRQPPRTGTPVTDAASRDTMFDSLCGCVGSGTTCLSLLLISLILTSRLTTISIALP